MWYMYILAAKIHMKFNKIYIKQGVTGLVLEPWRMAMERGGHWPG